MNSEYILEFRSIDPARRYSTSSDKPQFVYGFNQNALNSADEKIKELYLNGSKEVFGENKKISFFIMPYQRGFRWDAHDNVRKLLNDLFLYSEENCTQLKKTRLNYTQEFDDNTLDFYCLQTLTVKNVSKKGEGCWEVIDGQQRLTCIFLIYMVLASFCGPVYAPYEIVYQREGETFSLSQKISDYFSALSKRDIQSRDILQNDDLTESERADWFKQLIADVCELFDKSEKEENVTGSYRIDSYYVRSAMIEAVKFVSEGKDQDQIEALLECIKRNVYFLWYVVPEDSELISEDVFLKINSGSIPLTNAELIKSLVLRSSGDALKQNSRKWESLERGLSKDELWSFIAGNFHSDTRIELLLDVYARDNSIVENNYVGDISNNRYALFDWYNEYKDKCKSNEEFVEKVLKGIQDYYDRLAEWFDDVEIYHFVGLLTVYQKLGFRFGDYKTQQEMLKILLLDSENLSSKEEFIRKLKEKVLYCLKDGLKKENKPDKIVYLIEYPDTERYNNDFFNVNDDKKRVEAMLWLFNVYETVESVDNKTEYKKNQFKYKDNICRRFPFSEALSGAWSLEHIFPQHPDGKEKEELEKYEKGIKGIDESCLLKEDEVHLIKNIALLKVNTNSVLQNEMLNKKRSRLIAEIGKGAFIPCATVNAFMLYYNIDVSGENYDLENHQIGDDWNYWTVNDADCYEKAIIKCLEKMEGGLN